VESFLDKHGITVTLFSTYHDNNMGGFFCHVFRHVW